MGALEAGATASVEAQCEIPPFNCLISNSGSETGSWTLHGG